MSRCRIQLKGECDTFEAQFYASEKKILELTRLLHEEQTLIPTLHQIGCTMSFYLRILYYFAQGELMYSQFYLINITCVSFFCLKQN